MGLKWPLSNNLWLLVGTLDKCTYMFISLSLSLSIKHARAFTHSHTHPYSLSRLHLVTNTFLLPLFVVVTLVCIDRFQKSAGFIFLFIFINSPPLLQVFHWISPSLPRSLSLLLLSSLFVALFQACISSLSTFSLSSPKFLLHTSAISLFSFSLSYPKLLLSFTLPLSLSFVSLSPSNDPVLESLASHSSGCQGFFTGGHEP